jgi:uncharacterized protein (TIGR03435 family)
MDRMVGARLAPLLLILGAYATLNGQSERHEGPAFEVVSIKECASGQEEGSAASPGRLKLGCWPLWRVIAYAYDTYSNGKLDLTKPLAPAPPIGGPAWVNSTRYMIEATSGTPQGGAMMRGPMMQALLEERFQVKVHWETKEGPAYFLTADKNGTKLRATEAESCQKPDPIKVALSPALSQDGKPLCMGPIMTQRGPLTVFDLRGATVTVFSTFVHPDGLPVIDRTGLTGAYDFHLEWETDADGGVRNDDPSPHMTMILAIGDQLGLRLNRGKGKREVLVIDHVERLSQN